MRGATNLLRARGFGVRVVRGPEAGHEQLDRDHFAGGGVDDRRRLPGVVDEALRAGGVDLAHGLAAACGGPDPWAGRGPAPGRGRRSGSETRAAAHPPGDDRRGSDELAEVDAQVHPDHRHGVDPARARGVWGNRGADVARPGLLSASQRQDPGRATASGPRRAVSLSQGAGHGVPAHERSRPLRGYEEEGTGGGVSQRGPDVAAPGATVPPVLTHDFPHLEVGKAIPYGTYDVAHDRAVVNVGISHDTAEFAVESIRRWWRLLGKRAYPGARRVLISADAGGSTGPRLRAWTAHLQQLADELGLPITVCHYPPGTSKWNQVEHRPFSFISLNWRGQPSVHFQKTKLRHYPVESRLSLTLNPEYTMGSIPSGPGSGR